MYLVQQSYIFCPPTKKKSLKSQPILLEARALKIRHLLPSLFMLAAFIRTEPSSLCVVFIRNFIYLNGECNASLLVSLQH